MNSVILLVQMYGQSCGISAMQLAYFYRRVADNGSVQTLFI